jgi:hypothetical protein
VLETMTRIGRSENSEGYRGARESAERAIALDPSLATGYLAMSMVQMNHDWDWEGADTSLKRAGRLEPINHAERDLSSSVRARFHGDDQQEAPNKVKS